MKPAEGEANPDRDHGIGEVVMFQKEIEQHVERAEGDENGPPACEEHAPRGMLAARAAQPGEPGEPDEGDEDRAEGVGELSRLGRDAGENVDPVIRP